MSSVALMWADDGAKHGRRQGATIGERLIEGAAAYRERFGVAPDVCIVAPAELEAARRAQRRKIRSSQSTQPSTKKLEQVVRVLDEEAGVSSEDPF